MNGNRNDLMMQYLMNTMTQCWCKVTETEGQFTSESCLLFDDTNRTTHANHFFLLFCMHSCMNLFLVIGLWYSNSTCKDLHNPPHCLEADKFCWRDSSESPPLEETWKRLNKFIEIQSSLFDLQFFMKNLSWRTRWNSQLERLSWSWTLVERSEVTYRPCCVSMEYNFNVPIENFHSSWKSEIWWVQSEHFNNLSASIQVMSEYLRVMEVLTCRIWVLQSFTKTLKRGPYNRAPSHRIWLSP